MKIYLASLSLAGRSSSPEGPCPWALQAADRGYSGLEIADRELLGLGIRGRRELARILRDRGIDLVVDLNADLTLADPQARAREAAHAVGVLRLAGALGVRRVRIALGGQRLSVQGLRRRLGPPGGRGAAGSGGGPPGKRRRRIRRGVLRLAALVRGLMPAGGGGQARRARAIAALGPVAAEAAAEGIRMGIENHWGITARPEGILEVLRGVGAPGLGTCPDLGNIPAGLAAGAVLEALVPWAVLLHTKYPLGLRRGEGGWRELARRWEVCRRAGYRGPVTLEYEGWGDPWPACARMASLVRTAANG